MAHLKYKGLGLSQAAPGIHEPDSPFWLPVENEMDEAQAEDGDKEDQHTLGVADTISKTFLPNRYGPRTDGKL